MIDAAICGFAIGAGFAVMENIFYLHVLEGANPGVWVLRGFGTAVMHGGVAALGAAISVYLYESMRWKGPAQFVPGLLSAMALHSIFNQGLFSPEVSTLLTIAGISIALGLVFYFSEQSLRQWLGGKLDDDIHMLTMIASVEFQQTRPGLYLASLNEAFPAEVRGDMLSLLQLTAELSMRAKSDLLFREAGHEVPPDPEIDKQFKELRYLEKSIGPTGMLAIRPMLQRTSRDLWEMHHLQQIRN